jgi:hypothetical protein
MDLLTYILRFTTLGTIIISGIAIYTALRTNNRRLGADIFLKYSDRISNLRRSVPTAFWYDLSDADLGQLTPEQRGAVHEAIYSIFELYELKVYGFFPNAIWKIWEPDIERIIMLPVFRQELVTLKSRFAGHPRFEDWVERLRRANATKLTPG